MLFRSGILEVGFGSGPLLHYHCVTEPAETRDREGAQPGPVLVTMFFVGDSNDHRTGLLGSARSGRHGDNLALHRPLSPSECVRFILHNRGWASGADGAKLRSDRGHPTLRPLPIPRSGGKPVFRPAIFMTLAAFLLLAAPAAALDFGAQLIYGDDTDLGIGGRVEIPTPDLREQTRVAVDFNWYFPDESPGVDLTFWEINANWLHTVGTATEGAPSYYLGGGLNFAYNSVDFDAGGDDTDKNLGVNFLGGDRKSVV